MLSLADATIQVAEQIELAKQCAREECGITNRAEINSFVVGWLSSQLERYMLELDREKNKHLP